MLCSECGLEINNSPMYAKIEASIDEVGEIVIETKHYHRQPECLMWLIEKVEAELFRSSN